jgi:hypothetical protein
MRAVEWARKLLALIYEDGYTEKPDFKLLARHAKERGLYSVNTNVCDICLRLMHVWQKRSYYLSKEAEVRYYNGSPIK